MRSIPALAPDYLTPANLPYTRQDVLEAQEIVDAVVKFSGRREADLAWTSRFASRNPPCPPEEAVAHVLEAQEDLEEIVQALVLREFQRRGEVDLCLAAYDWFLGNCETPVISQFYDAALSACGSHFAKVEKALSVLEDCAAIGVKPSLFAYNMIISACSHSGKLEQAFDIFERALRDGVKLNTFTFDMLIRSCNFKRLGQWQRAMAAMAKLQEMYDEIPDTVLEALWDVAVAAMHRAERWQDAMAVFVALQKLGLENNTLVC